MNKMIMIGLAAALLVLPVSAYGLGVASDYLENDIYKIEIGTAHAEYGIRLQNMDDTAKTVMFTVASTENIASVRDHQETYVLPAKTTENPLIIDIYVPSGAEVGDIYGVSYSIKELMEGDAQVVFGTALTKSFTVEIVPTGEGTVIQEREPYGNSGFDTVLVIIVLLVLLATAFAWKTAAKRQKSKAKRRKK